MLRMLTLLVLVCALVPATACRGGRGGGGGGGAGFYGACTRTDQCVDLSTVCATIDWSGGFGSMCTVVDCFDDLDCATGVTGERGFCASVEGGANACYERCFRDGDCLPGWLCADAGGGESLCLPGGSVTVPARYFYETCTSSSECVDGGTVCATIDWSGGFGSMCTVVDCFDDLDCAVGATSERGFCAALEGATPTCYERCFRDGDCEPTFFCADVGGRESICVPG